MQHTLDKPMPVPTPVTRPFWEGLVEEQIRVQHCADCNHWVFYPRNRCNRCLSDRLDWRAVSGDATLYTFTIARQPTSPHFADESPQRIAVVELAEGVRMTTTLVEVDDDAIHIGMSLRPYFDHQSDGMTLLRFRPA